MMMSARVKWTSSELCSSGVLKYVVEETFEVPKFRSHGAPK
jgi:hypothetical protein